MYNNDSEVQININVNSDNSELLKGLDVWLNLGLISERQLRQICETHLTCAIPDISIPIPVVTPVKETELESTAEETKTIVTKRVGISLQLWQRFKEELSVRWLLFLGVILVVASSRVLAATQWEKAPDWIQYLILLTYTIGFWWASFWANKQDNLVLTSQTLRAISFLLIPVNFWALDTFVWVGNIWQWLLGAIALFSLSAIYFLETRSQQSLAITINFLILSYLQIGWSINNFILVAIYGGIFTIGIVFFFIKQKTGKLFIFSALVTILIRAIFIEELPWAYLGLLIGFCGWILTELSFPELDSESSFDDNKIVGNILQLLGGIFLLSGWAVSVTQVIWQATVVSLLALYFFYKRLTNYWLKCDVFALFIIGIQIYCLIEFLIPQSSRLDDYLWLLRLTDSHDEPLSLLSITVFPYLAIWVTFTGWLYHKNKVKLALSGEYLTLILSLILIIVGLFNPLLRSINLFLSTVTYVYIAYRSQFLRIPFIYIAHLLGLGAIITTVNYLLPDLNQQSWAIILLGLSTGELLISVRVKLCFNWYKYWYDSCWYFGLILASISYVLFWYKSEFLLFDNHNNYGNVLWLLIPLSLTIVSSINENKRRILAASLSCVGLILVQSLTLTHPVLRLVSLSTATVLMIINTYYFPFSLLAGINFVFAFGLVIALLWGKISLGGWFIVGAIAIICLWLLPILFKNTSDNLLKLYVKVANGWAIFLSSLKLIIITLGYLLQKPLSPQWELMLSSVLIAGVMIIRYQHKPNYGVVYGVTWAIEICLIEIFLLIQASRLELAVANIALGLLGLFILNRIKNHPYIHTISISPLVYALMAIYLRINYLNVYTGLITFGAATIGIGVGYFRSREKTITYLSIAGISLAVYELVIYQVLQSPEKNIVDACTLLAIVNAFFAFSYRLFAWWLHLKNKTTIFRIPRLEIHLIAHIHWALATLIRATGTALPQFIFLSSQPKLTPIGLVITLLLATYGILQARHTDPETSSSSANKYKDLWVYLGMTQIFSTLIYTRLIFSQLAFLDAYNVIIFTIFALAIYQIPWENLGWKAQVWQRISLGIPGLMVLITWQDISFLSLVMVAIFYLQISISQGNIRWSYFSYLLVSWALGRWLWQSQFDDPLWYAILAGLIFIYVAQVDPFYKNPPHNSERHYFRLLGSGIICLFAFLFHQETNLGLVPIVISLGFMIAGLITQIRAFLSVGTISFLLTVFYQLIFLIFLYSFLKWVISFISGITLILVAANFERHKGQFNRIWQNYWAQLEEWE